VGKQVASSDGNSGERASAGGSFDLHRYAVLQLTANNGHRRVNHRKEGVDGSSPSEGFAKALEAGLSIAATLHIFQIAEIWNRIGNVAGAASLTRLLWRRN
jgi:hypothetical protein